MIMLILTEVMGKDEPSSGDCGVARTVGNSIWENQLRKKGELKGLRINMKEGRKGFRKEHDFRVHWREDFWQGYGQGQVGGGPKIPGDLKIKISVVSTANPSLCLLSLPPSTASVEEDSSQSAIPRSVGISLPLTGMDTALTGVPAPAGRSLRQLRSCSTAESCAVRRGTQLLSPDPQRWKNRTLTKREGNKLHHFVVLSFSEFILQID